MNITYKGVTKDLKYYKGLPWDKPLTKEMKLYKRETGKNAVRGGKITGTFEYWLYWDKKRKPLTKIKQDKKIEKETKETKRIYNIIKEGAEYHGSKEQKINNIQISDDIVLKDVTKIHHKDGTYFYKYNLFYKNKSYGQDILWAKNKEELINKLYKERVRKYPFLKKKPTKTISKKYIPKDINIEKNRLNIEKLIKNNRNKVKNYNKTVDRIEKLRNDGYGKNYKEINELRSKLESLTSQINKNNEKIFKLSREAKIQIKYKKETKSKKMLYYIEGIEPF